MKTGIDHREMNKQRMTAVWGHDLETLKIADGDLAFPQLICSQGGLYYADADDLRRWRKLRESQHQSGTDHDKS
jgi:hypothetical protein